MVVVFVLLQLLVRPLALSPDHKCLIESLNGTIEAHQEGRLRRVGAEQQCWPTQAVNLHLDSSQVVVAGSEQDQQQQEEANKENRCNSSSIVANANQLGAHFMLMARRELFASLNSIFLGDLRANLIERVQEFTDCAYTSHEHRETILLLLNCIKLQLAKLVRLLHKLVSISNAHFNGQTAQQRLFSELTETLLDEISDAKFRQ